MTGEERWLTLRGGRVRYREAGAGPAVVLAHGLGLSADFYRRSYDAFADAGLRLIAPDLPGFGDTEGPRTGMGMDALADWLAAFATELGIDRCAWIGHSIGAQPVLRLVADRPERAAAAVLASPTGAPARLRRIHQVASFAADVGREPVALIPAVAREYFRSSKLAFVGTWLRSERHHPFRSDAERVRCPTLIVWGTNDPVLPNDRMELFRQRIPDARAVRIPGGAHGTVYAQADAFNRAVISFLHGVLR